MKTKEEEKNYNHCCDHCLQEMVVGAQHCHQRVNFTGIVGWVGCHEFFDDTAAFVMHVAKTGGCHYPGDIDRLRWTGVSWEVKEEDDRRRRATQAEASDRVYG